MVRPINATTLSDLRIRVTRIDQRNEDQISHCETWIHLSHVNTPTVEREREQRERRLDNSRRRKKTQKLHIAKLNIHPTMAFRVFSISRRRAFVSSCCHLNVNTFLHVSLYSTPPYLKQISRVSSQLCLPPTTSLRPREQDISRVTAFQL